MQNGKVQAWKAIPRGTTDGRHKRGLGLQWRRCSRRKTRRAAVRWGGGANVNRVRMEALASFRSSWEGGGKACLDRGEAPIDGLGGARPGNGAGWGGGLLTALAKVTGRWARPRPGTPLWGSRFGTFPCGVQRGDGRRRVAAGPFPCGAQAVARSAGGLGGAPANRRTASSSGLVFGILDEPTAFQEMP